MTNPAHRRLLRILWSNSLQLCGQEELGIQGSGLYPTISRINHSCAPNSAWSWVAKDRTRRSKVVRACRRIQEGQEITFSYIQLGIANLTREERKDRLANWFPACGCEVCAREDDGVRAELGDLHKEMRLLTREGRVREAAGVALQKVKAMEAVREEVVMEVSPDAADQCWEGVYVPNGGMTGEGEIAIKGVEGVTMGWVLGYFSVNLSRKEQRETEQTSSIDN